jgi:predicted MFS family arabinose efflux permease
MPTLVASTAAYCVANVSWWMQPDLVHHVMVRFGASESGAGLIATAELTAMALSSILLARLVGPRTFRTIALGGTLLALLGAAASIVASGYAVLFVARIATGLGEGGPLAVASAALAAFADPDRAYGKMNVVNVLFGAAVIFLLPLLAAQTGANAVFPMMFAALAICGLFLPLMPRTVRVQSHHGEQVGPSHGYFSRRLLMLVAAVFILAVTSGAMWSFYYVLGARAGLSDAAVNTAIGLAIITSISGSLLATWLGARWGRLLPVTVGTFVISAAILTMCAWPDPIAFRVAACLNVSAVFFLVPYFYGYAAAQDPSGRDGAVVGGAFLFAGAIGPLLGGTIMTAFGIEAMAWLVPLTNGIAWFLFSTVTRDQRERAGQRQSRVSGASELGEADRVASAQPGRQQQS